MALDNKVWNMGLKQFVLMYPKKGDTFLVREKIGHLSIGITYYYIHLAENNIFNYLKISRVLSKPKIRFNYKLNPLPILHENSDYYPSYYIPIKDDLPIYYFSEVNSDDMRDKSTGEKDISVDRLQEFGRFTVCMENNFDGIFTTLPVIVQE